MKIMAKDDSPKLIEKQAKRTNEVETQQPSESSDIYNKIVSFEEAEASRRNAEDDAQLYIKSCNEISKLLIEIANLKSANTDEKSIAMVREKQVEVTTLIIFLKRLNRFEKVRTKDCRLSIQKYREQVDNDHLQLQNLVYEQLQLSKEVLKCYDFKSIDEEMDLVSEEEFYSSAPESVSKPSITKDNPHELKIARLSWELVQRKELFAKIKQLEDSKKRFTKEIDEKKEKLACLEPNLQAILDATKPLQETLNVNVDKIEKISKNATLLPKPLYVLFVQIDALSRIYKWLDVNIVGQADEVRTHDQNFDDISSESDSDRDEELSRRRKATYERRKSAAAAAEQRLEECMKKHPMSVIMNIKLTNISASLQFHWLTTLEIISMVPTVSVQNIAGVINTDVLSPHNVFSVIFPDDTGEEYPNPSTFFHLKRAGLSSLPSSNIASGIAYNWCQKMCGLTFFADSSSIEVATSRNSIEDIVRALRQRLKSRIALAKEIKLLETNEANRDKHLQATMASFTAVTVADVERLPSVTRMFEARLVDHSFQFYRVVASLHDIKITSYVAVSPNYPSVLPVFVLEVNQNNVISTAVNSHHIRDFERELNTMAVSSGDDLLTKQILTFLRSTEVFISTELSPAKPVKATVFRAIEGRKRSHPYHYVESAGGIFTHR